MGNALTILIKYIPTEVLTLYIATVSSHDALASSISALTPLTIYWSFVALTPLLLFLLFAHDLAREKQALPGWRTWPWWNMFASTVAFAIWALAVPNNPYVRGPGAAAVSGLGALFVSTVLDLFEPIFENRLSPE